MMTVGDLMAELRKEHATPEDAIAQRDALIAPLAALHGLFSSLSRGTLRSFEQQYIGTHPPERPFALPPFGLFVQAQNKVLLECIEMELSPVGADIRARIGLPIFELKTQLGSAEDQKGATGATH